MKVSTDADGGGMAPRNPAMRLISNGWPPRLGLEDHSLTLPTSSASADGQ